MSSEKQINIDEIGQIISIAERFGLEELTVSEGDLSVTVRGAAGVFAHELIIKPEELRDPALRSPAPVAPVRRAGRRKSVETATARASKPSITLTSPMTGVFYRSSAPDAPPLVEVGDVVHIGQPVGIIEAMKVFSEVPSDVEGRVVDIVAANGKLIQADEPIMHLEPIETGE